MPDLAKARDLVQQLTAALADDPPSPTITTPDQFDRALSAAMPGAVLTLDPAFVSEAPLTIRTPVVLQQRQLPVTRIAADAPAPRFVGGLTVAADNVVLMGLEVRHPDSRMTIVTLAGANTLIDRVRVLGHPTNGGKRGIAANGNGNISIVHCYIEDCFGPYPGDDTQAICGWDMGPGLHIEDCYLSGGSETVMFGGADAASEDRMPADIVLVGNTITKRSTWQQQAVNVKNVLELKAARRVTISGNDISGSWGGHGQDGFLLMLTVRNQGGKAPWSTIEDVEIYHNTITGGAAAFNILGRDDHSNLPSGTMKRVNIHDNQFLGVDAVKFTGSKKLMQIGGGPEDVTIDRNTFESANHTSAVYFQGKMTLPATRLKVRNNTWPKTRYGIFGDNASVGHAWDSFVVDGEVSGNTEI
jgi:hypothetical protein